MSTGQPPSNDHIAAPMEHMEAGLGKTGINFPVGELSGLNNVLKNTGMFNAAENMVSQKFGGAETMLPYTDNSKV